MGGVAILVARRGDGGHRDAIWSWLQAYIERSHPLYPITVGEHTADEGPFNKSVALNRAAAAAGDWDIGVIHDADTFVSPANIERAVRLARQFKCMVVAHSEVHYLSEDGSQAVMDGFTGDWSPFITDTLRGGCSSVIAFPRSLWDRVAGMDERFVGWGEEDVAFAVACQTMARRIKRVNGNGWHLWHPLGTARNHAAPLYQANLALRERYVAARGQPSVMRLLIDEQQLGLDVVIPPTTIPRRLIRCVPEHTSDQVEAWWARAVELHPGWEHVTLRDPIDPKRYPITSPHWSRCGSGAQMAGLIRLEELATRGGVYIDSDVELYRSLEPLLHVPAFAAWEDDRTVPDAVFGCAAGHPQFTEMVHRAIAALGNGAWRSGPGVFTHMLPGRADVLLLPPASFYPYHYNEKERAGEDHGAHPFTFGAHHWAASWVGNERQVTPARARRGNV